VNIEITEDDLSDGQIAELLNLHLREMHKYSPSESIHALDVTKLGEQAITARLLEAILLEAEKRSYVEVSLETGSNDSFNSAISLYERYGFVECAPFGNYEHDPYSRFFSKKL